MQRGTPHSAERAMARKQVIPGDAAVVLVLQRLSDAERDGSKIYAILNDLERRRLSLHQTLALRICLETPTQPRAC